MLASEEAAAGTEEADSAWKRAEELAAGSGAPGVKGLRDRVERERAMAGKSMPAHRALSAKSQLEQSSTLKRLTGMGIEEDVSGR